MAKVKIRFRSSKAGNGQGSIFYQVTHNHVTHQRKTNYRLYSYEWDNSMSEVILTRFNPERTHHLSEIREKIKMDIRRFNDIITRFEHKGTNYTVDDVFAEFAISIHGDSLFSFMESVIHRLKSLNKLRTSETYAAALSSFRSFRENKDLALGEIDSDMMISYEMYLRNRGVSLNSSSFYMRNLRAVYNRAVEKELTVQRFPFKYVYTGVDKTSKRAVGLNVIKKIKELDLSRNLNYDFARDMFLFSFYTRGMSFVDMAFLRKKDLRNGVLSYRRRKTGQLLFIKWEKCMQEIIDKYDMSNTDLLLPIIDPLSNLDERKQYIYASHKINRCLKIIGMKLGLNVALTLYVARHSWASIAKSKNVPLSVISEGMGHDSEATTRIYLTSLDTVAVDKANSLILRSL